MLHLRLHMENMFRAADVLDVHNSEKYDLFPGNVYPRNGLACTHPADDRCNHNYGGGKASLFIQKGTVYSNVPVWRCEPPTDALRAAVPLICCVGTVVAAPSHALEDVSLYTLAWSGTERWECPKPGHCTIFERESTAMAYTFLDSGKTMPPPWTRFDWPRCEQCLCLDDFVCGEWSDGALCAACCAHTQAELAADDWEDPSKNVDYYFAT